MRVRVASFIYVENLVTPDSAPPRAIRSIPVECEIFIELTTPEEGDNRISALSKISSITGSPYIQSLRTAKPVLVAASPTAAAPEMYSRSDAKRIFTEY